METRRKVLARLASHHAGVHTAAINEGAVGEALHDDLKHNAQQTDTKRQIPEDFHFDPKALKPLSKMLWSMSVALGHALTAHKQFVKIKSATISPDGLVGGRGYVMAVKDVRTMLHDAVEALSALCDTVHDEIKGPHWQPKLAQLEGREVDRIQALMGEAERYLDNPEEEAEEDEEAAEEGGPASWHHPAVQKNDKNKKKDPKSGLPDGGDRETGPKSEPLRPDMRKAPVEKQASVQGETTDVRWTDEQPVPSFDTTVGIDEVVLPESAQAQKAAYASMAERVAVKFGNSALPVETMPGGPRVEHLDRGDSDQTGPFGTYNRDENMELSDQWRRDDGAGNEYNYPSDYDNDLHEKQGTAAIPDANMDSTPTEGFDFGIGDGNGDEATGQGAGGYGEGNPGAPDSNPGGGTGNQGVYGPASGLPKDFGGKVNPDDSDSTLTIENEIGGKGRYANDPWAATTAAPGTYPFGASDFQEVLGEEPMTREAWDGSFGPEHPVEPVATFMEPEQNFDYGAGLPGDADAGVARTDYYDGPKPVNMQNSAPSNVGATKLPGEQLPSKQTPVSQRPAHNQEHMFATGELPGDGTDATYDFDKDLGPDMTNRFEQQNTPYIKWDDNTPEMRPDPIHQRDPVQGPYVHNDLTERPSNG